MSIWLIWGLILLGAYLLGSIPTGYIAAKLLKGIDIREHGSGSTGATNVLRTLGKGPGAFVLLIDAVKGVLAIALVHWCFTFIKVDAVWLPVMLALAGLAAILGHSKSIWLGFSGGKSVATSLGILLAMSWQVALATAGVFAIVMAISRIVSLSSICGAIAVAILMLVFHQPLAYVLFGVAAGLYVIVRHSSNIRRLLAGTEPQLGQKLVTEEVEEAQLTTKDTKDTKEEIGNFVVKGE